jgi:hypothetical protein
MNKKTIYIVVAVIVVVLIVAVAGVMLLNNGGNDGTPNTTPTPAPATVVGANTLQFSVNDSAAGVIYQYASKNFNSSTEVIRVDMNLGAAGNYSYIIDTGAQNSFVSMDNGATWTASTDFAGDCENYAAPLHTYVDAIAASGNTADLAYSSTISIYCIAVNPTIADSFFATS